MILSTQGRSFWILDNLGPLRQIKENTAAENAVLFAPREAVRTPGRMGTPGIGLSTQLPVADAVVVRKSERRLYLLHRGEVIRSYRVSLGLQPQGAKVRLSRRWGNATLGPLRRRQPAEAPRSGSYVAGATPHSDPCARGSRPSPATSAAPC